MPEDDPLVAEIRELAEQIAAGPDDNVADLGAVIAEMYRRERAPIIALLNVDAMVREDERLPDEHDPRLVAVRERFRDRLRSLVAWAKETGRL